MYSDFCSFRLKQEKKIPRPYVVLLLTSVALASCSAPTTNDGLTADVVHSWTSGSESAAANVLVSAYQNQGGTWHETAVTGMQAGRSLAISRIIGGKPPTAVQWTLSQTVQDFGRQGLLTSLDSSAAHDHWEKRYPPYIYKNMQAGGHVMILPLGVHGGNWLFTSNAVLKRAGIMHAPGSWNEFFAAADRLKAQGLIPLAFSGEPWTQALAFESVLLGVGGQDFYQRVMVDHDPAAARSATMLKVFETFGRLKQYTDPGASARTWNAATGMVISGKAAMQFGGDWIKAEFGAAGLKAGNDFSCTFAPDNRGRMIVFADGFVFPSRPNGHGAAARDLLLKVLDDPAVIANFNRLKGSVPARLDVPFSGGDACTQKALDALRGPTTLVANSALAFDNDAEGQLRDLVTQFWAGSTNAEQSMQALAQLLEFIHAEPSR